MESEPHDLNKIALPLDKKKGVAKLVGNLNDQCCDRPNHEILYVRRSVNESEIADGDGILTLDQTSLKTLSLFPSQ